MAVARRFVKRRSIPPAHACWLAPVLAAVLAAGCASSAAVRVIPPPPPAAVVSPAEKADASIDWHGLVIAPFGTLLKDVPLAMHEVLLFHDDERPSADESKDCYGIDSQPPRFLGKVPSAYLLCFNHDHLSRIEASVALVANVADRDFAAACAAWQKRATAVAAPGAGGPAAPPPDGSPASSVAPAAAPTATCEGREADITFNARLHARSEDPDVPASITLVSGADSVPAVPRPR